MRNKLRSTTIIILFLLPIRLLGQTSNVSKKEEINVINSLLSEIINIDGNKLNPVDTSTIYFDKRLKSNLEKTTLNNGNYKQNTYIRRLRNNNLGEITIDDSKIKRLTNIRFIFEKNPDHSLDKYDLKGVLGTFSMSRISFDKDFTIGYFYFQVYCGEDCGWGGLVKVVKRNNGWKIGKYLSLYVN
jgi:hypothetical protein